MNAVDCPACDGHPGESCPECGGCGVVCEDCREPPEACECLSEEDAWWDHCDAQMDAEWNDPDLH